MSNKITKKFYQKFKEKQNKNFYQKLLNNRYKADVNVNAPNNINVKLIEENNFKLKRIVIAIISILLFSLGIMYVFNCKQFNEVFNNWDSSIFLDCVIFSLKDFLYSSLFISLTAFVIFIVFKRKI